MSIDTLDLTRRPWPPSELDYVIAAVECGPSPACELAAVRALIEASHARWVALPITPWCDATLERLGLERGPAVPEDGLLKWWRLPESWVLQRAAARGRLEVVDRAGITRIRIEYRRRDRDAWIAWTAVDTLERHPGSVDPGPVSAQIFEIAPRFGLEPLALRNLLYAAATQRRRSGAMLGLGLARTPRHMRRLADARGGWVSLLHDREGAVPWLVAYVTRPAGERGAVMESLGGAPDRGAVRLGAGGRGRAQAAGSRRQQHERQAPLAPAPRGRRRAFAGSPRRLAEVGARRAGRRPAVARARPAGRPGGHARDRPAPQLSVRDRRGRPRGRTARGRLLTVRQPDRARRRRAVRGAPALGFVAIPRGVIRAQAAAPVTPVPLEGRTKLERNPLHGRGRQAMLAGLGWSAAVAALTVFNTGITPLRDELAATDLQVALLPAVGIVITGLGTGLFARIGDRCDRRNLMSLLLCAIGVLLMTMARIQSIWPALLVAGAIGALGFFDPLSRGFATRGLDRDDRMRVGPLTMVGFSVGLALWTGMFAVVQEGLGVRIAFLCAGGAIVVLGVTLRLVLPSDPVDARARTAVAAGEAPVRDAGPVGLVAVIGFLSGLALATLYSLGAPLVAARGLDGGFLIWFQAANLAALLIPLWTRYAPGLRGVRRASVVMAVPPAAVLAALGSSDGRVVGWTVTAALAVLLLYGNACWFTLASALGGTTKAQGWLGVGRTLGVGAGFPTGPALCVLAGPEAAALVSLGISLGLLPLISGAVRRADPTTHSETEENA